MSVAAQKVQVIEAIAELGGRVTVPDVVARTGLPLETVSHQMNVIASETDANLEVGSRGNIYYCFQHALKYRYLARGVERILALCWDKSFQVAFFLFRISFGLILIFSLSVIVGILLFFQSVLSVFFGTTHTVGRMWGDFIGLMTKLAFREMLFWNSTRAEQETEKEKDGQPARRGFLLDCFSFLFGDVDRSKLLEDERWKLIAQAIRLNEGVIVAEHLAPYTGQDAEDEKMIFTVLAKFNGMPVVSERGNILYLFPSMRMRSAVDSYALLPPLLEEKSQDFTGIPKERLTPIISLAILNLLGSLYFFSLCISAGQPFAHFSLFFVLALYATLFVTIPATRWFVIRARNRRITARNAIARVYEEKLGAPDARLVAKLEDAEAVRRMDHNMTTEQIVYTTNKDYLEQITDRDFLEGVS